MVISLETKCKGHQGYLTLFISARSCTGSVSPVSLVMGPGLYPSKVGGLELLFLGPFNRFICKVCPHILSLYLVRFVTSPEHLRGSQLKYIFFVCMYVCVCVLFFPIDTRLHLGRMEIFHQKNIFYFFLR